MLFSAPHSYPFYIHYNPVEAGFVENDYDYIYSSARDFAEIKGLVKIEKL
jgi:hypothetical protein